MKTITLIFALFFIFITDVYSQVQITPDILKEYNIEMNEVIDTKTIYAEYTSKKIPEKSVQISGNITLKRQLTANHIEVILVLFDEKKEPVYLVNFATIRTESDKCKFIGLYEENSAYKYYALIIDIRYLSEQDKTKI